MDEQTSTPAPSATPAPVQEAAPQPPTPTVATQPQPTTPPPASAPAEQTTQPEPSGISRIVAGVIIVAVIVFLAYYFLF